MNRKSNVKLTISVADGGGPNNTYRDPIYLDWVPNSPSESDSSPPPTPKKEERKLLRVGFNTMDEDDEHDRRRRDVERDLNKLSRKGTGSVRYTEPRMSLLGKPLNYRQHRKDARMRKLQAKIYNFLERPKLWLSVTYHLLMFFTIVTCLVLSVLATIEDLDEELITNVVLHIEPVILVWLMVEFGVRVWAAGCRSRFQGWTGRARFIRRPLCIIDIVIIIACIIVLFVGTVSPMFAASSLRGLRFFQILRMVRMDRRGGTWKLLGSVVWAHRQELLTTLYIGVLGLLFFSFLVYLAEKDSEIPKFKSYADALWWGVITLCTVGYGDVVPTTWSGKLIAAFSAILGISFFALPAGILGSGFALKVQQQQRQKHLIRRRVPAAQLIQCLWRCYAADENSISVATWKPHMLPCPSPPSERPWKNNTSFVSRFSTRRRERNHSNNNGCNSPHSPLVARKEQQNRKSNPPPEPTEEIPDAINRSHLSLATGIADQRVDHLGVRRDNNSSPSFSFKDPFDDEPEHSPKMTKLTDVHKIAIRAIRKIKYFVARRKFKEALRPYDVKDVIEQYSSGHVDMLGRIKSLQSRLDVILGKSGSKRKDVYDSNQSLASRVVKVERSVEDIEAKLDLLIDLYKEDRKVLLQHCQDCLSSSSVVAQGEVTPCLKTSQNLKQPRSILSDKQFSEPSSPTGSRLNQHNQPIQRNLSDLSQRIKKRVTYRLMSLNDRPLKTGGCTSSKQIKRSVSVDSSDNVVPSVVSVPPCPKKAQKDNSGEENPANPPCSNDSESKSCPRKNLSYFRGRRVDGNADGEETVGGDSSDTVRVNMSITNTAPSESNTGDVTSPNLVHSTNHISPVDTSGQMSHFDFPGYKLKQ